MLEVWSGMDALRHSERYDALLGELSWRERWVAMIRGRWTGHDGWRSSPWRVVVPALAVGVGAAAAVAPLLPNSATPMHYAAQGEGRSITLPDQSSIILGPASTLSFEMADNQRVARLEGDAELQVAPDSTRPFIVKVGAAQVRVVGTRFTLAHRNSCTQLSVQSGTVEVISASAGPRRLQAGEEAAVIDDPRSRHSCIEAGEGRPLRWSYIDVPLANVLADVAPFYSQNIVIRWPDIARERVTISFDSTQIANMIDLLPEVLDLQLETGADGTVYIGR